MTILYLIKLLCRSIILALLCYDVYKTIQSIWKSYKSVQSKYPAITNIKDEKSKLSLKKTTQKLIIQVIYTRIILLCLYIGAGLYE